jgi:alkaline phosphatase D
MRVAIALAVAVLSLATVQLPARAQTLIRDVVITAGANANLESRAPQMNLTRIAFGSCAHQERPQPIWDAVLAYQPQLFLFGGDNVYGDQRGGRYVPNEQLQDSLQEAYRNALAIPGFVALRNTVPYLVTWDDHDYGKNDAGVELAHKRQSQQMFLEFWAVPNSDPRHRREGVYSAQMFGLAPRRVQVILLDTRYFRSPLQRASPRLPGLGPYQPDDDPSKTLLGEAQWQWLREQLLEPAELRLIVTSVQALAVGHGWEGWVNFPHERKELFDLIAQTRAKGVLFLSGDRHIAALYREAEGTPYPLIEMTSSGLTQSFPSNREPGPNRLGEVYGSPNFGGIDIDWEQRTVTLTIRSVSGMVERQLKVSLDELAAR